MRVSRAFVSIELHSDFETLNLSKAFLSKYVFVRFLVWRLEKRYVDLFFFVFLKKAKTVCLQGLKNKLKICNKVLIMILRKW